MDLKIVDSLVSRRLVVKHESAHFFFSFKDAVEDLESNLRTFLT